MDNVPARNLSPEKIISHRETEEEPVADARILFRLVRERLREIRKTLLGSPSGIEVEMCVLGYKVCADDVVTLIHQIEEELPRSKPIRRLKLRMVRRRATRLLRRVRKVLHQSSPSRAWYRLAATALEPGPTSIPSTF
ncbi:MAG: hypothetical protein ACR2GU_00380 [Rubrobacteraceae bacterium]